MKKIIILVVVILVIILGFVGLTMAGIVPDYLNTGLGLGEVKAAKPVIYLYPEKKELVSVKLNYKGSLIATYPEYNNEWKVFAYPNGDLINVKDNKPYSYLFWEGVDSKVKYDLSTGFVVKGDETVDFLQSKLKEIGLTPKEYNEFIVYWYPEMKNNKYNLIHFATKEEYNDNAILEIKPIPDSVLRVFMVFKPLDRFVDIKQQEIKPFSRTGFSVIEWGGTKLDR